MMGKEKHTEPMENKDLYPIISLKLASHKTPVFKEEKQKNWVIYGTDKEGGYYNNYPGYLAYLCNRSGKQNAFINGKVHLICGSGVGFDSTGLTIEQLAEANQFLNKKNANGDTLRQVIKKCTVDKKRYGGYYVEVITKKGKEGYEYLHMDFNKLRLDKDDDGFWYSKDWTSKKQSPEDSGLELIPFFDPEVKNERSIHFFYEYRPDLEYYPLPDYIASVVYAEVDVEVSNYRLNAIKSGFNAGTVLSFNNGKPTKPEQDKVEETVKSKFNGTDAANSLLISFSASKESAPTISRLAPQNVDDQLNGLNDQVMQELIVGHRITNPILVGIKTAGELGGKDQVEESYELLKHSYIIPNQLEIEEDFNYLLSLNGFSNRIFLKESKPFEEKVTSEQKWEIMTDAEKREAAKLPPVEEKVKPVISSTVHRFEEDDCCDHSFTEDEEKFADEQVEAFRQIGEDASGYKIIRNNYSFNAIDADSVFEHEITNYEFDILEGDVKILYRNIIDLLTKDPLMPNEVIAKTLKTTTNRISVAVNRLVSDGALTLSEKKSGDESSAKRTPTKQAVKILDKEGSAVGDIKVMYSYEPRPGLKPVLETTRPFCRKLIESNKLFTRQQIEQISGIVGFDVWTKRGGWYTQKGGAVTTPFCRHVWVQNVVRKK